MSLHAMGDEHFYLTAASEISEGKMDDALAAKAFAKAGGDEAKMRTTYMELRVVQLKAESARETARELGKTAKRVVGKTGDAVVSWLKIVLIIGAVTALVIGIFGKMNDSKPPRRTYSSTPTENPVTALGGQSVSGEELRENAFIAASDKQRAIDTWREALTRVREEAKTPPQIEAYNREYLLYTSWVDWLDKMNSEKRSLRP